MREKGNGKSNDKYILKICSYIDYKFHHKTPCIFLTSYERMSMPPLKLTSVYFIFSL